MASLRWHFSPAFNYSRTPGAYVLREIEKKYILFFLLRTHCDDVSGTRASQTNGDFIFATAGSGHYHQRKHRNSTFMSFCEKRFHIVTSSCPMPLSVYRKYHVCIYHFLINYNITLYHCFLPITLPLSTVEKEHSVATTAKLRSLKWLIPKTRLLLMWQCIHWLHNGFRTRTGGWEFWLLSERWHILSIPLKAGRGISAESCGLDDVLMSWRPCFWPVHPI